MDVDQANLRAALAWADAGFPVFPARLVMRKGKLEKVPCITDWQARATTNKARLRHWLRKWPDAMPSLPTGPRSGLAVLDLDRKGGKDGIAALRDLGHDPAALSPFTVTTPNGGGLHHYFRWPEGMGNRNTGLPPGVDVRGEGGYVIAPGAVSPKGRYTASDDDLDTLRLIGPEMLPHWPEALRPRATERPGDAMAEPGTVPLATLRDALHAIPNAEDNPDAHGRDWWLGIGMGLHHETGGSAEGAALWHEWSALWPGYDAGATGAAWRSFRRRDGALRTWATIRTEAEKHGWHDLRAFDSIPTADELAEIEALIADPPPDAPERAEPFFMDMADLLGTPAPAREWHVKDWIPAKTVHMLGGDGGTGKSLLGIQLAVATGTGTDWLGHEIGKPGVALYYGAEDDRDELHRRFEDVCRGLDVDPARHRGRVCWRSAVAEDTVFATVGRKGKVEATPVLRRMEQEIARLKPTLVVLDTLANLHALDPNSQEHAKAFVGLLIAISQRHGCTFVLLAHPSRSGLASGDGDGFSVGWNNGVRSRSYFAADKNNPQIMVLSQKKSNYGQRGLEIKVEWQQGIFVKVNDEYADASKAKHVFLEILDRLSAQGQSFSNTTGPNYAPARFAEEPEAEAARLSKDQLARAMKAMLKDGVLKVETYTKIDRKPGKRIARGDRDLMPPEDHFTDAMPGGEPHG